MNGHTSPFHAALQVPTAQFQCVNVCVCVFSYTVEYTGERPWFMVCQHTAPQSVSHRWFCGLSSHSPEKERETERKRERQRERERDREKERGWGSDFQSQVQQWPFAVTEGAIQYICMPLTNTHCTSKHQPASQSVNQERQSFILLHTRLPLIHTHTCGQMHAHTHAIVSSFSLYQSADG